VHRASSGASPRCRSSRGTGCGARVRRLGVAYSWAYCQALERMAGLPYRRGPTGCARWRSNSNAPRTTSATSGPRQRRRVCLRPYAVPAPEGTTAATVEQALGQRYLLDFVVPADASRPVGRRRQLVEQCANEIGAEARSLRAIYDEHPAARSLLRRGKAGSGTGQLARRRRHGAARAASHSTCVWTCRTRPTTRSKCAGACSMRATCSRASRSDRGTGESLRLVRDIVANLPAAPCRTRGRTGRRTRPSAWSRLAWTGGRGLEAGPQGPSLVATRRIRLAQLAASSTRSSAISFRLPLINKSFNLSYSGHDL